MEKLKFLLINHTFLKNTTSLSCIGPEKNITERPIFHAISYTYILVDVYQGFFSSRCYAEIGTNISRRSHSKNHKFTPSKNTVVSATNLSRRSRLRSKTVLKCILICSWIKLGKRIFSSVFSVLVIFGPQHGDSELMSVVPCKIR